MHWIRKNTVPPVRWTSPRPLTQLTILYFYILPVVLVSGQVPAHWFHNDLSDRQGSVNLSLYRELGVFHKVWSFIFTICINSVFLTNCHVHLYMDATMLYSIGDSVQLAMENLLHSFNALRAVMLMLMIINLAHYLDLEVTQQ